MALGFKFRPDWMPFYRVPSMVDNEVPSEWVTSSPDTVLVPPNWGAEAIRVATSADTNASSARALTPEVLQDAVDAVRRSNMLGLGTFEPYHAYLNACRQVEWESRPEPVRFGDTEIGKECLADKEMQADKDAEFRRGLQYCARCYYVEKPLDNKLPGCYKKCGRCGKDFPEVMARKLCPSCAVTHDECILCGQALD